MAKKTSLTKSVAKGAGGIAALAGTVALGAALLNREIREGITRGVGKAMGTIPEATKHPGKTARQLYRTAYHQITPNRRKKKKSNKK